MKLISYGGKGKISFETQVGPGFRPTNALSAAAATAVVASQMRRSLSIRGAVFAERGLIQNVKSAKITARKTHILCEFETSEVWLCIHLRFVLVLVLKVGKEFVVVTGVILKDGFFHVGDAWVWDGISNIGGQ